ncbi:hypothetical protein [Streptomyces sp. NBC_01268]|uniref:hypothetical protein n=1 Tax=Streptomyces sp. NBC_01268 TaxID=2903806 RepID=UPI002E303FD2|nr:hypothetical protein [Streptomyces sp. NBC_01268]
MTADADGPVGFPRFTQHVTAVNGFAYGVMGADLHVTATGVPVYLLARWRPAPSTDPQWLRELPSRMLNARRSVVPFVLREEELDDLVSWRDGDARLAVRWLYAPGGQGKTRLAGELARRSEEEGWTPAVAFHGPDADPVPPGSQDLRVADGGKLLLIVDYADRWSMESLTWLLKNVMLHKEEVRARVLMIARTDHAWPAVRALTDAHQARTSLRRLPPLDGDIERTLMFRTAVAAFRTLYGSRSTEELSPSDSLDGDDLGLPLALHVAALVAVDAHARGASAPAGLAGLTAYLLDREHLHWHRLYAAGNREGPPTGDDGSGYATEPEVMNRAVFTACLTGTVPHALGDAALRAQSLPRIDGVLRDHAFCYPPLDGGAGTVLEPLYPDRLAEDFVALTLPGHTGEYPVRSWAPRTVTALLDHGSSDGGAVPRWTPRLITVLASAAGPGRWQHVADLLNGLLSDDPGLAVAAGGAALAALADAPAVDARVLEEVAARFPVGSHPELDAGMATLTYRLAHHRLSRTQDPLAHATVRDDLAARLHHAGMHREAVVAQRDALPAWRHLARVDRARHGSGLATALADLAVARSGLGDESASAGSEGMRSDPVLHQIREARALYEELADEDPVAHRRGLAVTLRKMSTVLLARRGPADAARCADEATASFRLLPQNDLRQWREDLAHALSASGLMWQTAGDRERSVSHGEEAVRLYRALAEADPGALTVERCKAFLNLSVGYALLGRNREAIALAEEVLPTVRHFAQVNDVAWVSELALALNNLAINQARVGATGDALETAHAAVSLARQCEAADPVLHGGLLMMALITLANRLTEARRPRDSLAAAEEAVGVSRRNVRYDRRHHLPGLALAVRVLRERRLGLQDRSGAVEAAGEAVELLKELALQDPGTFLPSLREAESRFLMLTSIAVIGFDP